MLAEHDSDAEKPAGGERQLAGSEVYAQQKTAAVPAATSARLRDRSRAVCSSSS
jgi:hypothetical protein